MKKIFGPHAAENWPPGCKHLSGQLHSGLSVGPIQPHHLESTKPHKGSVLAVSAHSRSGSCPTSVWVSPDLGVGASQRRAGKSETRVTALSTGVIDTYACGCSDASTSHSIVARPRSQAAPPGTEAWIVCMTAWPTGAYFWCSRPSITGVVKSPVLKVGLRMSGTTVGQALARIIHDGSSRNRAVAKRDRRAEP